MRILATGLLALALTLTGALALPAEAGPGLAAVQRRLNTLHCDAGPADGNYGIHTKSALIRFQSRVGIAQTGTLNDATRKRLNASTAPRCDLRPVPASGSGRRIVISQAQNWVWVVRSDGSVRAQGGIVDNPSVLRKGTWATGSYCGRAARVKLNRSGSVWLDNFVRFAPCGIGFHRIPRYMSNGRQMHADHILGTNLAQSHGCIRLSATMARTIWDFTATGRTRVVVK